MNLFYVLGTNNYLVDSNFNISSSPVHSNKKDGVSLYPYILSFKDNGSDGVQEQVLDISSFTFGSISTYFQFYSDFVLTNNICNFIGCTSFSSLPILASVSIDNSSYEEFLILDSVTWTSITYGNSIYCIVGISGTNEITIGLSGNKITWTYNTITTTDPVNNPKVSFGNGIFILVDAAIYYSISGSSWSNVFDDVNIWNDIEYSGKGFIAYNGINSCTSLNGITWNSHTLPSIIGSDATAASWNNIVSNGDILCMKSSPDIIDTTSGMSSITFSNDGGLSWITQVLLDGANRGIVSLSIPTFWEHFNQTTES